MDLSEATRHKIRTIQNLIDKGDYQHARQLLIQMDHPIAKEMLARLDATPLRRSLGHRVLLLLAVLIALAGVFFLISGMLLLPDQTDNRAVADPLPDPSATLPPTLPPHSTQVAEQNPPLTQAATMSPQAFVRILGERNNFVRERIGWEGAVMGTVNLNDVFPLLDRQNDSVGDEWLLIELDSEQQGWIYGPTANVFIDDPSVVTVTVGLNPITDVPRITATPQAQALLQQTPILMIGDEINVIFERGQALGNQANRLSKVGDSNSISASFLTPFDQGNYELGTYPDLAETITYFQGSFGRESQAVKIGMNSATVQDPLFADNTLCQPNETPLDCEYRLHRPSFAVIMFGVNDVQHIVPRLYERYLREVVESSIEQGVIPILTTFPRREGYDGWEEAIALNAIMVNVAQAYQVPLINFWRAAQNLPNNGVGADNVHLTQSGEVIRFNGDETRWGHTLRNLLTIQMLDELRKALNQ